MFKLEPGAIQLSLVEPKRGDRVITVTDGSGAVVKSATIEEVV